MDFDHNKHFSYSITPCSECVYAHFVGGTKHIVECRINPPVTSAGWPEIHVTSSSGCGKGMMKHPLDRKNAPKVFRSIRYCNHVNEKPKGGKCDCVSDCGCRESMCKI